MTTKAIMIEEATKARNELAAELRQAIQAGNSQGAWFRDRVDALGYYNGLLVKLGAIPA